MKKLYWKETLVTAGYLSVGFLLKEVYAEVKGMHDDVIVIKETTVKKSEFDLEISSMKTRIALIEAIQSRERKQ